MGFKLRPEDAPFISSSGASTYIGLPPAKLIEIFGKPSGDDEFKVSGSYTFNTPNGGIITIYDWKATNLYDENFEETPESLWSSETNYEFNIGGDPKGKQQVDQFKAWIKSMLINSVRFITEEEDLPVPQKKPLTKKQKKEELTKIILSAIDDTNERKQRVTKLGVTYILNQILDKVKEI